VLGKEDELAQAAAGIAYSGIVLQDAGEFVPFAVLPGGDNALGLMFESLEEENLLLQLGNSAGGGGLIDLRYQVFDPDKANALHNKRTPPALVEEQTGLVVNRLLMNHAVHKGPLKAGVTYYLVFNNPGNLVRRGSMVTVLLGNAEVQHVVVR